MRPLNEQEVAYLIDLNKDKIEKYESDQVVSETYRQVAYTAKVLTSTMVEGSVPICNIVAKHMENKLSKEEVLLILYRCKQLFAMRVDASKILRLVIKVSFDQSANRPDEERLRIWQRVHALYS